MRTAHRVAVLVVVSAMLCPLHARAQDYNGAWANNADACAKLFAKDGGRTIILPDADLHGSGLIIDGNQIRGKMARCTVKARKQDGDIVHLGATCSTDVAVETVQFTLKAAGPDKIIRVFPGLPELDTSYVRCPIR
jgi:hypothetical protein